MTNTEGAEEKGCFNISLDYIISVARSQSASQWMEITLNMVLQVSGAEMT